MSELGLFQRNNAGILVRNGKIFLSGNQGGVSAGDLYNALQYSGLVTEDMTAEEMLAVLAEVYPECIDLYIANRTKGVPSNLTEDVSAARTYDLSSYVPDLANNNYYHAGTLTNVNVTEDSISFTSSLTGFGLGLPIKLKAGKTYQLSVEDVTCDKAYGIGALFYENGGTYIGNSVAATFLKEFTVPDNAYYTLLHFHSDVGNAAFSKPKLKEVL